MTEQQNDNDLKENEQQHKKLKTNNQKTNTKQHKHETQIAKNQTTSPKSERANSLRKQKIVDRLKLISQELDTYNPRNRIEVFKEIIKRQKQYYEKAIPESKQKLKEMNFKLKRLSFKSKQQSQTEDHQFGILADIDKKMLDVERNLREMSDQMFSASSRLENIDRKSEELGKEELRLSNLNVPPEALFCNFIDIIGVYYEDGKVFYVDQNNLKIQEISAENREKFWSL